MLTTRGLVLSHLSGFTRTVWDKGAVSYKGFGEELISHQTLRSTSLWMINSE